MSASWLARVARAFGLTLWVATVFVGSQFIISYALAILLLLLPELKGINDSLFVTIYAALSYSLAVALAIAVPWWLKRRTSKIELGIQRLPSWRDIALGLLGYVPYFVLLLVVTTLISKVVGENGLNANQDVPFNGLAQNFEFIVAFVTLVILAPFAEELLFRGYLLGKLNSFLPSWLSIAITALLFGAMHLPGSTGVQWLVGVDTMLLGVVLGVLRVYTKTIWAGVILHAIKNSIAFYFLFINPIILGML